MTHDDYPVKSFRTPTAFEQWLNKNHKKADGLWLKIAKAKKTKLWDGLCPYCKSPTKNDGRQLLFD